MNCFMDSAFSRWKARVLDKEFQIFSVSGHSINPFVLFADTAAEKENAAQKGGGSFVSWQCECGEKGDGERNYEDDQIHKSAKQEFKNT